MSIKAEAAAATEIMECGTSLAEDAWTVSSSIVAATTTTTTTTTVNYGEKEKGGNATLVQEAWAQIHELRSKLAADVISDPCDSNDNDDVAANTDNANRKHNFPTFVSPYERPTPTTKAFSSSSGGVVGSHRGMSIPLVYCDQTASQRPVHSIEEYLRRTSMPCHANTHTNITYTGSQSTAFVSEARQIVGECTGARITGKAAIDTVIFGGNGVTGCVGILVDCLNLKGVVEEAAKTSGDNGSNNNGDDDKRPVVFVGPHEHHSNLLPWRESGCEVVTVPESTGGTVDMGELERFLRSKEYGRSSGRLRIGAFSAVSNVTGLIADVDRIAIVLHRYGALAFFDYASGAPYVKMDMNPSAVQFKDSTMMKEDGQEEVVDPSKDAIYFSPHKCYGGTSTPGVLVIKKHLISQTNPPAISGGGTVFYVTNRDHRFLSNRIERYEGGTPDGIGIQRVGLALLAGRRVSSEYERIVQSANANNAKNMRLAEGKAEKVPPMTLLEYECSTYDRVVAELKKNAPNLIMLGCDHDNNEAANIREGQSSSCAGRHLPVFSFLIRAGKRFLHYNYVCAILNDVFGIQSRGGCQCAGPYSQRLLGLTTYDTSIDEEVPNEANRQIERALLRSDRPCELLRPGYTRLSLPFKGLREEEVDYVVKAMAWVAKNGWALLPQYRCDHRTGEWRHWSRRGKPLGKNERRWLSRFDILAAPTKLADNGATARPMTEDSTPFSETVRASRARLDEAVGNADAILQTAKRDPRFLSEVEKMNSADGMLGSGAANDVGEGGVDATLENLRWYVYPQEVAGCLREGLEMVPSTLDDEALLGGINARMDIANRVNRGGSGRGSNDAEMEPSGVASVVTNTSPQVRDNVTSLPSKSDLIPFQDGDHAGEAPYDEIRAGYEDGELGEACEIFSRSKDKWTPIQDFIQEHDGEGAVGSIADAAGADDVALASRRKRNLSAMEEESQSCSEGMHSIKVGSSTAPLDEIESSPNPTAKQTKDNLPPAVAKREKKKPSRGSSQWGRSSAPHIASSKDSSCAEVVSAPTPIANNGNDSKMSETGPNIADKVSAPLEEEATKIVPSVPTNLSNKKKKNKGKLKPPPKLMRFITQATIQWDMIQEGDRLLLGLSGGKDSLTLLHCLLEIQRKLPIKFDIEVCTIDPMTPSFDPSPLIPYVEGLGLKYHYIRDDIVARANTSGKDGKTVSSLCAFCARMKRGNLYTCARKNNCNKLVLAQHLDDCAESFFMSIMHNGFIRTMKANYEINAGDVSVIRPLVYCRESLMTEFAKSANLPVINENCPACFEEPKERARIKKLLSREETLYPDLYNQIRRALIPVMHDDSTSIIRSYLEETIAKSRKVPHGKSKKAKITNSSNNDVDNRSSTNTPSINSNSSNGVSLQRSSGTTLELATEEELIRELAKRRAAKFKHSGAMKRLSGDKNGAAALPEDATGQMCSLTGGDGMIPCRELME